MACHTPPMPMPRRSMPMAPLDGDLMPPMLMSVRSLRLALAGLVIALLLGLPATAGAAEEPAFHFEV